MKKMIVEVVVGYMLKILKNGKSIKKFKSKFNAIKHGDYDCFIAVKAFKDAMKILNKYNIKII